MAAETELVKIVRRKIQARQFSRVDEGKVKFKTPRGWVWAEDGDWIVQLDAETNILLPGDAMAFLTTKDDDGLEA